MTDTPDTPEEELTEEGLTALVEEQNLAGVPWLIHDDAGRILRYGSAPDLAGAQLQVNGPDEHLLILPVEVEISDETHWVSQVGGMTSEVAERPELAFDKTEIVADGVDMAVLTGLPDPCLVLVDDQEIEVTGGRIELVTTLPAVYHIVIEDPFPARAFAAEIIAHAP